jgi:hypothetical protein
MSNLENALRELREKRSHAQIEIEKLDQIIAGIESLNGTGSSSKTTHPRHHTMSASARKRISLAQKARWAKAKSNTTSVKPKRTMSPSARRKISLLQKARWAKFRAAKKAA